MFRKVKMSEYIFSYTSGSGSGSGSGSDLIPCTPCPIPSDKVNTHYIDTSSMVYAGSSDQCCPLLPNPQTVPCDLSCPLPPEYSLIDYRRSNIDSNGNPIEYPINSTDICCPIVSRSDDFQELRCYNCPPFYGSLRPDEVYDTNHFYKRYGDGTIEGEYCCPIVTLTTEPSGVSSGLPCDDCTPKSSGIYSIEEPCTSCIDGECVEHSPMPCKPLSWTDYAYFYPGVSPSTHTIDTSVKYCESPGSLSTSACPLKIKDFIDVDQTNVLNIEPNSVSFYESATQYGSIVKEGSGTLVVTEYTGARLVQCNDGTLIINNPQAFDPNVTFLVEKTGKIICNFGSQKMSIGALFFGTDDNSSYTNELVIPTFSGKIDLGFGGITVSQNGIPYLRSLLLSGRNGGNWDGNVGITTSANKNGIKNIGYTINPNGSITIAWAIPGDTTLDGKVDMFDIVKILASGKYNSGATDAQWFDGDSNYDGRVDIMDIVSILSTGQYNQGSYLPNDKSFKISWNPSNQFFGNNAPNLELVTKDTSKRSLERIYDPKFKVGAKDKNIVCLPMSEIDCRQIAGSLYNDDNIPCTDSSCSRLEIPKPHMGACCLPPSGCEIIRDTDTQKAFELCENTLQGIWLGYNTVCNDSSCTENDKKIIRG